MRSFSLFLFLVSIPMFAQHVDTVSVHAIEGVEIVSDKVPTNVKSSVPLQQIDNERMLKLGVQNITDALSHIAGITVRDYGGAGGMKTVSVRGIGSRHTGVMYDGIALSDCQTGEIDLARYSLDNMESMSLVVGDGDNIFAPARNASCSAYVSFNSAKPSVNDTTIHAKVQCSVGSWGTLMPAFYYSQRMNRHLSLSASGEYTHSNNDYPFTLYNVSLVTREKRRNSRMNSGHGEINVSYDFDERNRIDTKVYYYDNDRQLPGIVHYYTDDNDETLRERNIFAQTRYRFHADKLAVMVNGKWNWAMSDYHNGMPSGGIKSEQYWQREYYISGAAMYIPIHWLALDYSADYAFQNLNSSIAVNGRPLRHSFLQTVAAKATTERLTFVGRLLHSNYVNEADGNISGKNYSHLSPSVSLSYKLLSNSDLYVRAFWKSIFRMPTFNELYFYHIGNAVLSPEKTSQFNVGMTYDSGTKKEFWHVAFTADAYLNKVKDKIIAIPFNMFVWRMMNLSSVTAYGMDITANVSYHFSPQHSVELATNYSWQKAEDRTSKVATYYKYQIAYTPIHTFSATLTWLNPYVNLALTTNGATKRWTTNEHSQGTDIAGYTEIGINAFRSMTLGKTKLTARAGVLNITDKQYSIVAHYPMPGRSWRFTLLLEF